MRAYNPSRRSASNLLGGLRGLISTLFVGVISTQEPPSSVGFRF